MCIHFTLYINKYIIVLFSGDAESRGKHSDPEANADCMKTRERKKKRGRERRTEGGFSFQKTGGREQRAFGCWDLLWKKKGEVGGATKKKKGISHICPVCRTELGIRLVDLRETAC